MFITYQGSRADISTHLWNPTNKTDRFRITAKKWGWPPTAAGIGFSSPANRRSKRSSAAHFRSFYLLNVSQLPPMTIRLSWRGTALGVRLRTIAGTKVGPFIHTLTQLIIQAKGNRGRTASPYWTGSRYTGLPCHWVWLDLTLTWWQANSDS